LVNALPGIEIGVHLHSSAMNWKEKLDAALNAGCKRFDGALKGIGGCPMADDELVGNMDTELMIPYFEKKGLLNKLDHAALRQCSQMATDIFI
jgi:hydroxymethylglutaryl-CoA lyase